MTNPNYYLPWYSLCSFLRAPQLLQALASPLYLSLSNYPERVFWEAGEHNRPEFCPHIVSVIIPQGFYKVVISQESREESPQKGWKLG